MQRGALADAKLKNFVKGLIMPGRTLNISLNTIDLYSFIILALLAVLKPNKVRLMETENLGAYSMFFKQMIPGLVDYTGLELVAIYGVTSTDINVIDIEDKYGEGVLIAAETDGLNGIRIHRLKHVFLTYQDEKVKIGKESVKAQLLIKDLLGIIEKEQLLSKEAITELRKFLALARTKPDTKSPPPETGKTNTINTYVVINPQNGVSDVLLGVAKAGIVDILVGPGSVLVSLGEYKLEFDRNFRMKLVQHESKQTKQQKQQQVAQPLQDTPALNTQIQPTPHMPAQPSQAVQAQTNAQPQAQTKDTSAAQAQAQQAVSNQAVQQQTQPQPQSQPVQPQQDEQVPWGDPEGQKVKAKLAVLEEKLNKINGQQGEKDTQAAPPQDLLEQVKALEEQFSAQQDRQEDKQEVEVLESDTSGAQPTKQQQLQPRLQALTASEINKESKVDAGQKTKAQPAGSLSDDSPSKDKQDKGQADKPKKDEEKAMQIDVEQWAKRISSWLDS